MNRDRALNELATQLLTARTGVVVAGLGVFRKKRDLVKQSVLSRRLEPPQIRWYLKRTSTYAVASEGMLQWPYPSSVLIQQVPSDWTEPFELPGLGMVTPSAVGEGKLEPSHPLLLHFLAAYRLPAIVPPIRSALIHNTKEPAVLQKQVKRGGLKKQLSMLGRAALWLAFLGPALYLFLHYNGLNEGQRAGVGEVNVRHDSSLLPDFPHLYPPVDSTLIEQDSVVSIPFDSRGVASDTLLSPLASDSDVTEAVVVVGCFKSIRNAERQELRLKKAGFEPAEVDASAGGLHRVGTRLAVRSVAEADSFLLLVRAKVHPDAWLLDEY